MPVPAKASATLCLRHCCWFSPPLPVCSRWATREPAPLKAKDNHRPDAQWGPGSAAIQWRGDMLDGCGGEVDQMPQVDLPIEGRAADPRGGPNR